MGTTTGFDARWVVCDLNLTEKSFAERYKYRYEYGGEDKDADIWELSPESEDPLRWNPLQWIPHLAIDTQAAIIAETIGMLTDLPKTGVEYLAETLNELYRENGVWGIYHEIPKQWSVVQEDEATALGLQPGTPLHKLPELDSDAILIGRSTKVDIAMWYGKVVKLHSETPETEKEYQYQSVFLEHMSIFLEEPFATRFSKGADSISLEKRVLSSPGITIIHGWRGTYDSEWEPKMSHETIGIPVSWSSSRLCEYIYPPLSFLMLFLQQSIIWLLAADFIMWREMFLDGVEEGPIEPIPQLLISLDETCRNLLNTRARPEITKILHDIYSNIHIFVWSPLWQAT